MNADELAVGRHYAMTGKPLRVCELRHFLSRATGNLIVQVLTGTQAGERLIVGPSTLMYEVVPREDDSTRWRPMNRAEQARRAGLL